MCRLPGSLVCSFLGYNVVTGGSTGSVHLASALDLSCFVILKLMIFFLPPSASLPISSHPRAACLQTGRWKFGREKDRKRTSRKRWRLMRRSKQHAPRDTNTQEVETAIVLIDKSVCGRFEPVAALSTRHRAYDWDWSRLRQYLFIQFLYLHMVQEAREARGAHSLPKQQRWLQLVGQAFLLSRADEAAMRRTCCSSQDSW